MGKIFISYRRDDAEEAAGRLSDHLVNQFGRENLFMDVDGIDPGRDFRKVIDDTLTVRRPARRDREKLARLPGRSRTPSPR